MYFDRKTRAIFRSRPPWKDRSPGVILINKSRFIVAYSYGHRGTLDIRGRTGSRYVESEPESIALKSASVSRRGRKNRRARACMRAREKKEAHARWLRARPTQRNTLFYNAPLARPRAFKRSGRLFSFEAVTAFFFIFSFASGYKNVIIWATTQVKFRHPHRMTAVYYIRGVIFYLCMQIFGECKNLK